MGRTAFSIGANTFAFFTRNPRGGAAKKIDPDDAAALRELLTENSFGKLVAHAPYTLNPCAADKRVREFAYTAMADDLERMEYLPGNYYNFHPGSHVGQGITEGIKLTSELLNDILVPGQSTMVLLETMAGKGSEIGSTFEQLSDVISAVRLNEKVGVCLDTCHVYDGGYDIAEDLDGVLENFDRTVGLERLKAVHLNDTMAILIIIPLLAPGHVLFLMAYFQGVDKAIFESARIDGAREITLLFNIAVPLIVPGLVTIGFQIIIMYWNDAYTSLYFADSIIPVALYIQRWQTYVQSLKVAAQGGLFGLLVGSADDIPDVTVQFALAVFTTIPLIIIFLCFQRFYVKGLTAGAVKG